MLYLLIFSLSILSVNGLSSFLTHYEPLNYTTSDLARVTRSAQPDDSVKLKFDAFNRTFKLRLRKIHPDESSFAEGATIEFGNQTMEVDRGADMYKGVVEGDDGSRVYGSVDEGVFTGVIETSDGKEYGVEYSASYNSSVPFHSFIYDVAHMKMPKVNQAKRPNAREEESMCGLSDPKIAKSLYVDESDSFPSPPPLGRTKRDGEKAQLKDGFYDFKECPLFIHVDHLLYKHYYDGVGNKDPIKTQKKLHAKIEKEVAGVNEVYKDVDFGGIKGISFRAARTKITESKDEEGYPYKDEGLDVNAFLGVNAMQNHGEMCLGYVMTYRDFAGGTLGLAFVGGVCSTYKPNSNNQKSTNAGIVTYLNHGEPVLDRLSYLTLAHEIGHNFGSPHDETDECKGGSDGQYIMWYAATSGDQPNNQKFSTCSIKKMTEKLHKVMVINPDPDPKQPIEGSTRNCFTATGAAVCGNGITEPGEVCDCGQTPEECTKNGDECCHPGNVETWKCTLKKKEHPEYECAPSQGPCCDSSCKLTNGNKCEEETECAAASLCKGSDTAWNATCPTPLPRDNDKPCMNAAGACRDGICNQNMLCASATMQECESTGKTCLRHCMKDGVCKSTAELPDFLNEKYKQKGRWGQAGVMLRPQSQCLQGQGTCDQFDNCRKVKASGALGKSFKAFNSLGQMAKDKIWVPIVIGIVVLVLLIVIIKFCSYATPSSNPNKPKAKSIKQIKNMMSDRVKQLSKRATKKKGKAVTPQTGTAAQTPASKTKTKDDDE